MTLYSFGQAYDRYYSNSAWNSSADAAIWSNTTFSPFAAGSSISALAYGSNTWVVAGSTGNIATSNNLVNWQTYPIISPDHVLINSMVYANNKFFGVGMRKYTNSNGPFVPGSESAEIYVSTNSAPGSWKAVFNTYLDPSIFYSIKSANSTLVVSGSIGSQAVIYYSLDWGSSWVQRILPNRVQMVTDSTWYNGVWYLSTDIGIVSTASLTTPVWQFSDYYPRLNGINSNSQGQLVATSAQSIFSSQDQFTWKTTSILGYSFRNSVYYNNLWLVGTYSLLTTYSLFSSTDSINWTGSNNGINNQHWLVI